jgi:D-alanyl-lipoteichoic acid acyltransferase DltB (MBOAT superfamily)
MWQVSDKSLLFYLFSFHPSTQLRRPINIAIGVQIRYFFRFLFSLLTMEFILHYMYVVAIKDAKAWPDDTPLELSMIGVWNLIIVWLKVSHLAGF